MPNARQLVLAALALVPLAGPAHAIDCSSDDLTQLDLDTCNADAFKHADAKLNAVYKELHARLAHSKEYTQSLIKAERAWIAFRDANCDFTTIGSEGGSIRPMLVSQCQTEMTETRTKELESILHCPEGDPGCPLP